MDRRAQGWSYLASVLPGFVMMMAGVALMIWYVPHRIGAPVYCTIAGMHLFFCGWIGRLQREVNQLRREGQRTGDTCPSEGVNERTEQ